MRSSVRSRLAPPNKISSICVLFALLATAACTGNDDVYRVFDRQDRYLDAQSRTASPDHYDHDEVHFTLQHEDHTLHAVCDLSTVNHVEADATCALQPRREYHCQPGQKEGKVTFPVSDLTCKDDAGHSVYLYITRQE